MTDAQSDILKFWFEETVPEQWFQKSSEFDRDITDRFSDHYQSAMAGNYDEWMETAKGCLALVILLDQFPRNMFRDKPEMFASDDKALKIAKYAVAQKFDEHLSLHEKVFLYLPYEHSENLEDQKTSLSLFKETKGEDPTFYDYAQKHYDVIEQFGRFPHRNDILNRDSTGEEKEYLAQPGSGF